MATQKPKDAKTVKTTRTKNTKSVAAKKAPVKKTSATPGDSKKAPEKLFISSGGFVAPKKAQPKKDTTKKIEKIKIGRPNEIKNKRRATVDLTDEIITGIAKVTKHAPKSLSPYCRKAVIAQLALDGFKIKE